MRFFKSPYSRKRCNTFTFTAREKVEEMDQWKRGKLYFGSETKRVEHMGTVRDELWIDAFRDTGWAWLMDWWISKFPTYEFNVMSVNSWRTWRHRRKAGVRNDLHKGVNGRTAEGAHLLFGLLLIAADLQVILQHSAQRQRDTCYCSPDLLSACIIRMWQVVIGNSLWWTFLANGLITQQECWFMWGNEEGDSGWITLLLKTYQMFGSWSSQRKARLFFHLETFCLTTTDPLPRIPWKRRGHARLRSVPWDCKLIFLWGWAYNLKNDLPVALFALLVVFVLFSSQ